jgi:hypothetical protein
MPPSSPSPRPPVLTSAAWTTGGRLDPDSVILGLALTAGTHWWADRQYTLRALARWVGKVEFYELGDPGVAPCGTGAYALDQAWHIAWLWITTLIIT